MEEFVEKKNFLKIGGKTHHIPIMNRFSRLSFFHHNPTTTCIINTINKSKFLNSCYSTSKRRKQKLNVKKTICKPNKKDNL